MKTCPNRKGGSLTRLTFGRKQLQHTFAHIPSELAKQSGQLAPHCSGLGVVVIEFCPPQRVAQGTLMPVHSPHIYLQTVVFLFQSFIYLVGNPISSSLFAYLDRVDSFPA